FFDNNKIEKTKNENLKFIQNEKIENAKNEINKIEEKIDKNEKEKLEKDVIELGFKTFGYNKKVLSPKFESSSSYSYETSEENLDKLNEKDFKENVDSKTNFDLLHENAFKTINFVNNKIEFIEDGDIFQTNFKNIEKNEQIKKEYENNLIESIEKMNEIFDKDKKAKNQKLDKFSNFVQIVDTNIKNFNKEIMKIEDLNSRDFVVRKIFVHLLLTKDNLEKRKSKIITIFSHREFVKIFIDSLTFVSPLFLPLFDRNSVDSILAIRSKNLDDFKTVLKNVIEILASLQNFDEIKRFSWKWLSLIANGRNVHMFVLKLCLLFLQNLNKKDKQIYKLVRFFKHKTKN
ncbi:hypothetical protein MHBO_002066, partial [Bonamia ostreae]